MYIFLDFEWDLADLVSILCVILQPIFLNYFFIKFLINKKKKNSQNNSGQS